MAMCKVYAGGVNVVQRTRSDSGDEGNSIATKQRMSVSRQVVRDMLKCADSLEVMAQRIRDDVAISNGGTVLLYQEWDVIARELDEAAKQARKNACDLMIYVYN